jgi:hypothetical protein
MLKKLGDGEKQLRGLVDCKIFPLVEEVDEFGENGNAMLGIYFAFMETISFINGCNFIHFYHPLFTLLTAP